MKIIPVQPQPDQHVTDSPTEAARRTFGGRLPSRRTFGGRLPSRRTFGARIP